MRFCPQPLPPNLVWCQVGLPPPLEPWFQIPHKLHPCSLHQLASPTSENQIVEKSSDPKTSATRLHPWIMRSSRSLGPSRAWTIPWRHNEMPCQMSLRWASHQRNTKARWGNHQSLHHRDMARSYCKIGWPLTQCPSEKHSMYLQHANHSTPCVLRWKSAHRSSLTNSTESEG